MSSLIGTNGTAVVHANGSPSIKAVDNSVAVAAGIGTLVLGLIIVVVVAVTLLIVGRRQLQRRAWDTRYKKLPTSDPVPTIKLNDPPPPRVTYHTAMDLSSFELSPKYSAPALGNDTARRARLTREFNRCRTKDPELPNAENIFGEKSSPASFKGSPRISVPSEKAASPPELSLTLVYVRHECVLTVKVERIVGIPSREDGSLADPYISIFFESKIPFLRQRKTSKTHAERKESAPEFGDVIRCDHMSPDELINSTMQIQILDYRPYGRHPLMALANLPLGQVVFENEVACLTLPLELNKNTNVAGLVLISLCYTPETSKLNVILLRAKDLVKGSAKQIDAQGKVIVAVGDKVYGKLKTGKKTTSDSPIFNEQLSCSVDPSDMREISVVVTIFNEHKSAQRREVGAVNISPSSPGDGFRHWNNVLATPEKPISEWHQLVFV